MNFSIDNGLSRCRAAAVTAVLLLCCSGAATAGVDDAWNASPATQDTSWAQAYAAPVNPSNSGGNEKIVYQLYYTQRTGGSNGYAGQIWLGKFRENADGSRTFLGYESDNSVCNGWCPQPWN